MSQLSSFSKALLCEISRMFIPGSVGAGMVKAKTCGPGSVEPLGHPCRPFWSVADPPFIIQTGLGDALFDGFKQNVSTVFGIDSHTSLSARASSSPVVIVTPNLMMSLGFRPDPEVLAGNIPEPHIPELGLHTQTATISLAAIFRLEPPGGLNPLIEMLPGVQEVTVRPTGSEFKLLPACQFCAVSWIPR
jgi:hypothetical protein